MSADVAAQRSTARHVAMQRVSLHGSCWRDTLHEMMLAPLLSLASNELVMSFEAFVSPSLVSCFRSL